VGVVYALNKSQALPTLAQIEQLELIVSFVSSTASVQDFSSSASQNQPFRVIDSSPQERRTQVAPPIRMEGFTLNPEFERMEMGGTLVSLSPTEFLLMHTLASSPDQPISPDELMDRCWTKDSRPADNAVDVAIFRLRKKLNKIDSGKGLIKTVRGNGYMFVPPSVEPSAAIVAD
jgi:DNA-binding response OmpR family regulator